MHAYIEEEDYKLYVVADGMGGHNAGEVARKWLWRMLNYIKETFIRNEDSNVLKNAIVYANEEYICIKARWKSIKVWEQL